MIMTVLKPQPNSELKKKKNLNDSSLEPPPQKKKNLWMRGACYGDAESQHLEMTGISSKTLYICLPWIIGNVRSHM